MRTGNIKLDKGNSTAHISGAVATIMRLDQAVRHCVVIENVYTNRSVDFVIDSFLSLDMCERFLRLAD
jgi:hypothetical protein